MQTVNEGISKRVAEAKKAMDIAAEKANKAAAAVRKVEDDIFNERIGQKRNIQG